MASLLVAAAVAAVGCMERASTADNDLVIDNLELVISDAEIDFSLPTDVDVDAEGRVYVLDRRLRQIVVISPEGDHLATIGRRGQGPGEFGLPLGLAVRGEILWVLDFNRGVQALDLEGGYLAEYPVSGVLRDFAFDPGGGLMYASNRVFARGGLVSMLDERGEETALVGELVTPETDWNFGAIREEILQGRMPEELRNLSLPIAGPGGTIWVFVQTESLLRRYGPELELLAEARVEVPEREAIDLQYFVEFAEAPVGDIFFFPTLVQDGFATEDALLLLWNTVEGQPGLITVHDESGAIVQRLILPALESGASGSSIWRLTVDMPRRRLYITLSDTASLLAADLPEGVLF